MFNSTLKLVLVDLKCSLVYLAAVSIPLGEGRPDDVFAGRPNVAAGPVAFILQILNFTSINIISSNIVIFINEN